MRRSRLVVTVVLLVICVSFAGRRVSGQFRYWSGQNVVPVFEGWERNPDGSFNFVFGYFNRNYEESLDVLVGPDNNIEPGGPDQGQPTFFAPARQKFLFRVKVPKDWPITKRLVWTLTVRGKTEKANAFLLPEWEMNSQVMALNGGGGGGGGVDEDYNQPPVITFAGPLSAAFPDGASVVAAVTDDGVPKPRAARRGGPPRPPLLRVAWLQFRGPVGGRVSFSPSTSPVVNGKAETVATVTMP
ncbi:MAG TPA: hypothetical protein VFO87_09810, partial [Nitrospira sp.]|nr:hypothetical protein [Nitrospira sp.]